MAPIQIAQSILFSEGARPDAVGFCLEALQRFSEMEEDGLRRVAYEIAMLGTTGLDVNDPERKYTLTSLGGSFSGLQLVCFMYVGLAQLAPEQDVGMDLSSEYAQALEIFKATKVN